MLDIQQAGKLRAMTNRCLPVPEALKKGDQIDGFELVRAFQGTDRVWLAEKEGQRVVCKFAPVEAVDSETHLDAFTRETWNAVRMSSEHFVRAYEPANQTQRYYLMEFVDAPNLRSVLHERRLSVDSAVALGQFLAQARRVSKLNPNVPPWLETLIARSIAIDPQVRYQHYSELLFDLTNPTRVQPFMEGTPLLQRNPLAFYKTGFFVLLALVLWLALRWLAHI